MGDDAIYCAGGAETGQGHYCYSSGAQDGSFFGWEAVFLPRGKVLCNYQLLDLVRAIVPSEQ